MPETPETSDQWRIRVAVRCLLLLRESLERNGMRYSGAMVPNLTSVTDVLTIPIDTLREQVAMTPVLNPDIEYTPQMPVGSPDFTPHQRSAHRRARGGSYPD